MAISVIMPKQGQSVESCIITQWFKSKGDKVDSGDMLFSYETDKAAFEQEATGSGILLDVFYSEGDEVPVLETVAVIGKAGENYDSLRPGSKEDTVGVNEAGKEPSNSPDQISPNTPLVEGEENGAEGKLRISPLARKLAQELDITLSGITGTGPLGRIIERDIRSAASHTGTKVTVKPEEKRSFTGKDAPSQTHVSAKTETGTVVHKDQDITIRKLSNMRRIIAGKMHQSIQNSAQLTHHMSADARGLLGWRKEIKADKGKEGVADISINDMVCFAVIKALKKHPAMNAHFTGEGIKEFNSVHLGFAVDTERGLMVPAIRNADELNVGGLARRLRELAEGCRKGNIDPELLNSESAGFTVSNLGAYGVEMFTPVLNLPQVGILGVNTITYRPADTGDGTIGFIPVIGLSLTYDHRAVDGAPASVFLGEIKKEIENIIRYK